ncbi:Protein pob1 [Pseudocercospora fuligena]|uniref:Protein pob1 n=1 Tax=Pseudocercospora fuligena TaxID=685502 RepID=A0A8H6RDK7_9PEZI|nr:Protein pob1 [Pseudocercospora fuligena]
MQAITPRTPLEARADMFTRAKSTSFFESRASQMRPVSLVSEATEILDTDFEDESDYGGASPKDSFDSFDDRRRSQTTISSYDEARTPSPRTSTQSRPPLSIHVPSVEGPKGPHLFRSSQVSAEFNFEYALQMSPLLPKEQPTRTTTAFTDATLTPVTANPNQSFTIEAALARPEADMRDPEAHIRSWSTQQVIDWMYETGIDSTVIECFDIHDINGTVLLDLQFEDLKELDIASFGKRHQLWNAICLLKGEDVHPSPQATPFQDISRPCTSNTRRSPSRGRLAQSPIADNDERPSSPARGKSKRRGRKAPKTNDVISPQESVSIVAIEQLLPKPHTCAKGERCAKWRKQQRELQQLKDENGIGRFPISPAKGGRIFLTGDPGNAMTAENMLPNVRLQSPQQPQQAQVQGLLRLEDPFRQTNETPEPSAGFPSVVASSDLLGPGQLPEFALHQDVLDQLGMRDPQDNVKQFLNFQHVQSPVEENRPPTPPFEMFPSQSVSPFPAATPNPHLFYQEAPAAMQRPTYTPGPHEQLRSLPKLDIPRSASAGPQLNSSCYMSPQTAHPTTAAAMTICRSATASPQNIYRMGTPASEMDVPITTSLQPMQGPISRDTSQSVPPSMQYRPQLQRSHSRKESTSWRRPSMQLPAVQENEILTSPSSSDSEAKSKRPSIASTGRTQSADSVSVPDPAKHSPVVRDFGYGPDCSHSGWMKKRQRTKMLRHEWSESHFRLKGTQLTQHNSARLSALVQDSINVDDYAVACSSVSQNSKLSSAFKALAIKDDKKKEGVDPTAFAFQLVPQAKASDEKRKVVVNGKTHHFAVKTKDQRIDWMRELMLAKAREQRGKGFEVEVNGEKA